VLALVLTESGLRAKLGGALAAAASGALGVATLDLPAGGLVGAGNMLAPLFAGLFGAPVLLDALTGAGVPEQDSPEVTTPPAAVGVFALVGTLGGAAVGYLPGVSSAVAATLALGVVPAAGARGFLVTTSGVNTANTVFALFALVAFGTPRTGVLVAVQRAGVAVDLRPLLAGVVAGGAAGFVLVVSLGDRYLEAVGRLDYPRLSVGVLGLLVVLIAVLTGPLGIAVFAAATLVGLVPVRFGARRANLMGVLLVPLALGM
jgi:putative membrane protein